MFMKEHDLRSRKPKTKANKTGKGSAETHLVVHLLNADRGKEETLRVQWHIPRTSLEGVRKWAKLLSRGRDLAKRSEQRRREQSLGGRILGAFL